MTNENSANALSGIPDVYHPARPSGRKKAIVPAEDFAAAFCGALGTMLALYERQRSAMGREVSASLLCTGLNMASRALIEEALLGLEREAMNTTAAHRRAHR